MSTEKMDHETNIANYLLNTPDFFDRHASLLADIQLISPHGKRAVSLQERQIELQRDKTKALELKLAEMMRYAQENDAIQAKLQRWVQQLLMHTQLSNLPQTLVDTLIHEFAVPQAAIKLWGVDTSCASEPWATGASADVMSFASSMTLPFCGPNTGYEAVQWMNDAAQVKSVALIALRNTASQAEQPACIGLLALGSPDAERFRTGMGTAFLQRIGEITSAAVSKLISSDS